MPDKSPIIGPSGSPRTLVEQAAAAAMKAAEERLQADGAELQKMLVVILAGQTGQVWDAVAAGHGVEDPKEVFAMLIAEAVSVGRQLGVKVLVGPLNQG